MFIKLTDSQKQEMQKYLMPECAVNLNDGTWDEIEPDDFWNLDWYIIDHAYPEQKVTCELNYPYSVQTLYKKQWFEIDVISEKLYHTILEIK